MPGEPAPAAVSWVESANDAATDFPLENLPLGVFARSGDADRQIGVAIGDRVLDLSACVSTGLLNDLDARSRSACGQSTLNSLAALGRSAVTRLRGSVTALLRADGDRASATRSAADYVLLPAADCTMAVPFDVGDYTDFYASVDHATNVGAMFRPDNPLLPNYKWVPIGYHGRASSIVVSGSGVVRPRGQIRPDPNAPPVFEPTRSMDYELEVGAWIATSNSLAEPVGIRNALEHVLGLSLVNDWSARDVQSWEYQPLGPFLAKSFATSVSPWVVTLDALEPFRTARAARPVGDPDPLPHLDDPADASAGAFDVTLEVSLLTPRMREHGEQPVRLSRSALASIYWTFAQMVAHHTSNGCNLRTGDLLASGTVSGPDRESRGCLLELASRGAEPVVLPNGETRSFLADGDEVILLGWCEREGARRIGFGECRGVVLPAVTT